MHKLAQSVLAYIRTQDLIRPGHRVGIAVSGGADSVALLRLMVELKDEIGMVLSLVHVNHQLRGAESDADEQFVRKLAQANSLELFSESSEVKGYASEHKLSVEAAARTLRYQYFEHLLCRNKLNRIATAHTRDDQAETVLLKLARGAGTRGLAGIFPRVAVSGQASAISKNATGAAQGALADERFQPALRSGAPKGPTTDDYPSIIRPLLATRRLHLRSYLSNLHQPWREDSSNRDLRHTRNRIRHGILPRFERHVNPSVCEALADAAEIARGEESYWQTKIANLLPQLCTSNAENLTLDPERLKTFPFAVRRRLLRAAAESIGLNLEFRHIEEILALDRQSQSVALPNGWVATLLKAELKFHHGHQGVSTYEYELVVPGQVHAPEARITVEAVFANGSRATSECAVDSRFAQRPLTLRNWRPGERFWPVHTKVPRKIKDLLQDRHITGEQKKAWPVIAAGDEIVWLRGFGIRRDLATKNNQGILIREFPLDTRT